MCENKNSINSNSINYIKKNIQNKEEMISKKTKIIYYLFEKWTGGNEIDKLQNEISNLYNNYQEYFEDECKEEYEKQWDELDKLEWQRD